MRAEQIGDVANGETGAKQGARGGDCLNSANHMRLTRRMASAVSSICVSSSNPKSATALTSWASSSAHDGSVGGWTTGGLLRVAISASPSARSQPGGASCMPSRARCALGEHRARQAVVGIRARRLSTEVVIPPRSDPRKHIKFVQVGRGWKERESRWLDHGTRRYARRCRARVSGLGGLFGERRRRFDGSIRDRGVGRAPAHHTCPPRDAARDEQHRRD
jgi:hypothetical protein